MTLQPAIVNVASYTVEQVADAFNVDPKTIRRLIWKGEMGCVRVGRAVRVTREQLDAYLAKGGAR